MTNRLRVVSVGIGIIALFSLGCGGAKEPAELHVAAAANLTNVLYELGRTFQTASGIAVIPTYGATAQLAQQIENGAPIDVFLSADTAHVDQLIDKGVADASSRTVFARGRLAIWAPLRPDISSLNDLASAQVKVVGCAKPELAPYGAAAVEALQHAKLWQTVEPKLVYAQSISAAKQYADSGNAAASFTALSLIFNSGGHYVLVDQGLYTPIDQAMCIVKQTKHAEGAGRFRAFMTSAAAQQILARYGYEKPASN
jgi:molybdate transport system substrate-binding protein